MEREDFEQQLTALRRDAGPDTIAELADTAIAYWNGERLVYAAVSANGTGVLAGEFELDARRWTDWKSWLADWLTDPVLSARRDLPGGT